MQERKGGGEGRGVKERGGGGERGGGRGGLNSWHTPCVDGLNSVFHLQVSGERGSGGSQGMGSYGEGLGKYHSQGNTFDPQRAEGRELHAHCICH